jgi:hypothetical protein
MKATLEFDLPEEGSYHRECLNGPRAFQFLRETAEMIRARTKYGQRELPAEEVLEKLRREIYESFPEIDE